MADIILIACHGPLAAGLKGAAELIVGQQYPIIAAPAFEGDLEQIDAAVASALATAGPSGRVFALTDLLGGSVNTRIAGVQDARLTLITGANLGLVIELAISLQSIDSDGLDRILASAREGLQVVGLPHHAADEEDF